MFLFKAGNTAPDDKAAVGKSGVVPLHLFFRNEMDGRVIIREIIGHGLDLFLNPGQVCPLFRHDKAFSGVHVTGLKYRIFSLPDLLNRRLYRNGILSGVFDPADPADRVGMSLADAPAPEGIIGAFRQTGCRDHTVQGEHTGIPAHGNNADLTAFTGCRVDRGKMLRNPGMGIKAVDDIEHLRVFGCLDRQVGRAAAAEDHHIDFIFKGRNLRHVMYAHAFRADLQCFGRPSGEDSLQLHVGILPDGALHAPAQVAIS